MISQEFPRWSTPSPSPSLKQESFKQTGSIESVLDDISAELPPPLSLPPSPVESSLQPLDTIKDPKKNSPKTAHDQLLQESYPAVEEDIDQLREIVKYFVLADKQRSKTVHQQWKASKNKPSSVISKQLDAINSKLTTYTTASTAITKKGDGAWEEWMKRKLQAQKEKRPSSTPISSQQNKSDNRKDSKAAFNQWLQRKEEQRMEEKAKRRNLKLIEELKRQERQDRAQTAYDIWLYENEKIKPALRRHSNVSDSSLNEILDFLDKSY